MLAEYSPTATTAYPQKEYGYRNGELLITAAGSSCGVGNTGPRTWLGTDGALGHLTGNAEGTNWAVYAGSDSATAMVFGPYDTTYGQGHHTAQFKLMVDNNSGSDVVGSLDVVTGYGGNVLATRQVRRSDFTSANQWQTFILQFDNPCFGLVEARVWWAGNANMKFAQLTITPLDVATSGVQWLVTDQLGTPRMVFDKTGSLSGVSRHDYLPFGEELYAGTGGRASTEGYNTDNVRQHFTGYEADGETGLNFAQARYQSPVQGRFTSVDPLKSFNRYSYVHNNPLTFIDLDGMMYGEPDQYYIDGVSAMPSLALGLLRAGAGVLGPLETTRWNPNSGGPDVGGFDTFRAVGPYVGWFNMHGVFISVNAYVNGEYAGSAASFQSFGFGGNPAIGSYDQWPPEWPPVDPTNGWGTKTTGPPRVTLPGGEPINKTPQTGKPGVEVDPNYVNQPRINPSKPQLPSNATFWDKVKSILAGAAEIFGGTATDILGPVVLPATQIRHQVCTQNPANPGCSKGPPS